MLTKADPIPVKTLQELLRLDARSGKLFWRRRDEEWFDNHRGRAKQTCLMWNKKFAGKEAFTAKAKGYHRGSIFNTRYAAHRVVFALAHGHWPADGVDHINGKPGDNRPENLRPADHSTQARNLAIPRTNTSGAIGVSWQEGRRKWEAFVHIGHKKINLGQFLKFEDAVAARQAANERYGFHPNHGRVAA